MFKSVEYAGFEDRPDLRPLAERATQVLAGEIGHEWHNQVDVGWRPLPSAPSHVLELSLTFNPPIGTSGASGSIRDSDFRPGEDEELKSRLRRVWLATLDRLIDQRKKVWEEYLRQPVEV